MSFVGLITVVVAIVLAVPIGTLLIECLAALLPLRRSLLAPLATPPRIDVLIPAHNEAAVIENTLRNILAQLKPGDRACVVADNCSDDTAAIARRCGALVWERSDAHNRGKGFALDYGLTQLEADHGEVVVIADADCELTPGTLERIAAQAVVERRPVQAVYLMSCPAAPGPRDVVSQFAVMVKNLVRARGVARLGGPCLLSGSGMAFPWEIIRAAKLCSGNIVEDMQLSFDLLTTGHGAALCAEAQVTAPLPRLRQAAVTQRTRWEHGHLKTLLTQVPRLLAAAVRQRRLVLLAAALDLVIPPLSLLVVLWTLAFGVSLATAAISGVWWPTGMIAGEGAALFAAILITLLAFGSAGTARTVLLSVPIYVLSKIPIYARFIVRPQTAWVRTERDASV